MKYNYSDMIRLVKCTYPVCSKSAGNDLCHSLSGENDSNQKISLMRPLIKKYLRTKTFLYLIFFLNRVILFSKASASLIFV